MATHSNAVDWQSMYDASVAQAGTEKENKTSKQMPIVRSGRSDTVDTREARSIRDAANALAALWKTNLRR